MFFNTPAVVLRRHKLSDADLILTLFTRKAGKMSVIAKGARHPKNKLASGSSPFVFGEFNIVTGDKWNRLDAVDIHESFYHLREDITRLAYASYLLEFCDHVVMEGATNPRLFTLLVETLSLMEEEDADLDLLKVAFEIKAMDYLGFCMELHTCVSCGSTEITEFRISPFEGGVICQNCKEYVQGARYVGETIPKIIEYMRVKDIRIINKTKIHVNYLKKMDKLLMEYVLFHLDRKKFKSLDFLNTIRR